MKKWLLLGFLFPSVAVAQQLTVDPNIVRGCFAGTPIGAIFPECLGDASNQCQIKNNAQSTIGITTCIQAEAVVWDQILNEEYKWTQGANKDADARGQQAGISRVDTLRDAQRAWITFRDADCHAQYARWQDGTIRSVVGANCHLVKTAQRALVLRDMRGQ